MTTKPKIDEQDESETAARCRRTLERLDGLAEAIAEMRAALGAGACDDATGGDAR